MYEVFDHLIDQDQVVGILKEATAAAKDSTDESQAMVHAWLFTGPPGSGRSNAAMAFAASLLCPQSGCGSCNHCTTALAGSHADVELMRTEGLSIKIDEIRDLIVRASWSPAVAAYRVVVIEDADRLTESAANALLKSIEEPGTRTIWLLCAPTLSDVLPTIRSRTRNLTLRTPSTLAVAKLLQSENITAVLANFAARASQGHVGRARYLARDESARDRRAAVLKLPITITDLASAFKAAQLLVQAAKKEAEDEASNRDDKEISDLKQAWGQQGSKLTQGGSKAVKELEKEQKSRTTRMVRDYLDRALLDIATFFRDVLLMQANSQEIAEVIINSDMQPEILRVATSSTSQQSLQKLEAIMKARMNLSHNANTLLTIEALMVQLR
jgi:DNA polymerase-3 subunit delta'